MITLTKEWLQQTIAELEEERDAVPGAVNEDAAMALAAIKLALASIEAESEPASEDYPETLPCPVTLEPGLKFGKGVPTRTMLNALQRRAEYYADLEAMTPEQRAEHGAGMKEFAAMLQGAENAESPTTMQTAPSLDSSQIIAESPSGNSPVIPDCSCGTCRPVTFTDSRFVVCSECGNKRCPHANDHRNACTGSNEPGQEGRAYPAAPQQEVK